MTEHHPTLPLTARERREALREAVEEMQDMVEWFRGLREKNLRPHWQAEHLAVSGARRLAWRSIDRVERLARVPHPRAGRHLGAGS